MKIRALNALSCATALAMAGLGFAPVAAQAAGADGTGPAAWRCGNSYSDQPCPGGRTLDVHDARSASQRHTQDMQTRQTQRTADRLARERRGLEAQAAGQAPTVIASRGRPDATASAGTDRKRSRLRERPRWIDDRLRPFTARDPESPGRRRKPGVRD